MLLVGRSMSYLYLDLKHMTSNLEIIAAWADCQASVNQLFNSKCPTSISVFSDPSPVHMVDLGNVYVNL